MSIKAYAGVARLPFLILPFTLVASGAAAAAWMRGPYRPPASEQSRIISGNNRKVRAAWLARK
jgi:hypothetical protein